MYIFFPQLLFRKWFERICGGLIVGVLVMKCVYLIAGEILLNGLKGRSLQCLDFVASLLELNPCRRLCAKKALEHPWVAASKA